MTECGDVATTRDYRKAKDLRAGDVIASPFVQSLRTWRHSTCAVVLSVEPLVRHADGVRVRGERLVTITLFADGGVHYVTKAAWVEFTLLTRAASHQAILSGCP